MTEAPRRAEVALFLFAKPPIAGEVKTRLAQSIGAVAAAALARAFLEDAVEAVSALGWADGALASTGAVEARLPVVPQGEGDLGARLERVLRHGLETHAAALAIGSDSPGLPRQLLDEARLALRTHDAVLGPADDGGFYLLGLRRCPEGLLAGLPWSSPETFAATAARLNERGLSVARLAPWFDVDVADDLVRLREAFAAGLHAPRTQAALRDLP